MEVRRICQWCGKPFIAQKTTTRFCSPECAKRSYKHRIKERKMELRHAQEMHELRQNLERQDYFTFSQAARLMGVSRQYIYKLVKEDKLRASRISNKMSFIRRADIELMLKSKPYERITTKEEFDIAEYYTAEQVAERYKVSTKWVWNYCRQNNIPKVRIRQFNYYSKKHIDAAFAKYDVDKPHGMVHARRSTGEIRHDPCRHPFASVPQQHPLKEGTRTNLLLQAPHFDLSKSTEQESSAEYYTVKEAMEKFKLTRDSVYGILQFHEIKREKHGRFVRFLKPLPQSGLRQGDGM